MHFPKRGRLVGCCPKKCGLPSESIDEKSLFFCYLSMTNCHGLGRGDCFASTKQTVSFKDAVPVLLSLPMQAGSQCWFLQAFNHKKFALVTLSVLHSDLVSPEAEFVKFYMKTWHESKNRMSMNIQCLSSELSCKAMKSVFAACQSGSFSVTLGNSDIFESTQIQPKHIATSMLSHIEVSLKGTHTWVIARQ